MELFWLKCDPVLKTLNFKKMFSQFDTAQFFRCKQICLALLMAICMSCMIEQNIFAQLQQERVEKAQAGQNLPQQSGAGISLPQNRQGQDMLLYRSTVSTTYPDINSQPLPYATSTFEGGRRVDNVISLGDFIVDERQLLRKMQLIDAEFTSAPAVEVMRGLAEAADINYVLPELESKNISMRLRMPAFKALELIADEFGLELQREDDLWFFRPRDKEALKAVVYKLQNIHLGKSGGATAGAETSTFGAGGAGASATGTTGATGTTANNINTNATASTTSTSTTAGSTGTDINSDNRTGSLLTPIEDRFKEGSDVLATVREILGLARRNRLDTETASDQENNAASTTTEENDSFVSYNADANTLYIIATEKQHQWVEKYLATVDKAVSNISIDAIFIESDLNPNESLGTDWSAVASGYRFSLGGGADGTITWGPSLENISLPTGLILDSQGLEMTLRAWITENRARLARYPRVVTSNNKLVKIQTTTNIPIITNASTVGLTSTSDTTTGGTTAGSNITQTDFSSGTQEIGTIITLVPQQINKNLILLKIGIEISSGVPEDQNVGETLTGRITTSSTVYEGEVKVPSGKTLAIGGLETIAERSNIRRVPWLSQIPIFGFLFKDKNKDFRRTNITLLITPTILGDYSATTVVPDPEKWRKAAQARANRDLNAVEKAASEEDKDEWLYDSPKRWFNKNSSGSSNSKIKKNPNNSRP